MAAFDDFVPQFRNATDRWPEAPTLAGHYRAVIDSYQSGAFDLLVTCKSFIECVCRTIIVEFGREEPEGEVSTTRLLVETLKVLGIQNMRGASRLDEILSAHNKMADALSWMRNNHDPSAHGKDGFLDTLTINECRAYLVTADSILGFLLAAHAGKEPDLLSTREPYERFDRFHRRIDETVSMSASIDEETGLLMVLLRASSDSEEIELFLEPSKLLYALDRTAYVELLRAATAPSVAAESEPEGAPLVTGDFTQLAAPESEVVTEYSGPLAALKGPLQDYLGSLEGPEAMAAATGLRDSLLATAERNMGLDWASRENLLAAMKVALRRTLRKFGIEAGRSETTAEALVKWLRENAAHHSERPSGA